MYCPKCAAMNGENAKFCRVCGQNLVVVSDAITGRIPPVAPTDRRGRSRRDRNREDREPPTLHSGIIKLFTGLGFLIAALALMLSGRENFWGVFLLFPAFAAIGKGVAAIISARQMQQPNMPYQQMHPPPRQQALTPQDTHVPRTGELYETPGQRVAPPASVTEGTTKLIEQNPERIREKA